MPLDALPPVCILAGGQGTRLGERVRDVPKPLLEVAGEPFLIHQLRLLVRLRRAEAVICAGYLGEMIEKRIGAQRCGVRVAYSHDGPGLDGTLGAIRRALALLPERFLVLYGDTYLRVDYRAANRAWRESGLGALMVVLRNEGCWDTSNARYERGRVRAYDKHVPTADMSWIDYGLGGLTAGAFESRSGGRERARGPLPRIGSARRALRLCRPRSASTISARRAPCARPTPSCAPTPAR